MSKQTIYTQLRRAGLSEAGALALMGNWQCESNLEACRLQGDFSQDRTASHDYADRVDNGILSEADYIRDAKGWGLAQWTYYARKRDLLMFCRTHSVSIASEEAQVDFACKELREQYPILWQALTTAGADALYAATDAVCRQYERPAYDNVEDRYRAACRLQQTLDLADPVSAADTNEEQADEPDDAFWPPRTLATGMVGADVQALQGILMARGFNCGSVSGIFDTRTHNMVAGFQAKAGLTADGIAGPLTWTALLKR